MTIHWKVVAQYFSVVLFGFPFYPVCNFGNFINFRLGTVSSEMVNTVFITFSVGFFILHLDSIIMHPLVSIYSIFLSP